MKDYKIMYSSPYYCLVNLQGYVLKRSTNKEEIEKFKMEVSDE